MANKNGGGDALSAEQISDVSDGSASGRSFNLTKRSKEDLIRLLSILVGELEAQDIFIRDLSARLSRQDVVKNNYFVNKLQDPFVALSRDDIAVGKKRSDHEKKDFVEPIQLLEKVFEEFYGQQRKIKQQMSVASKIHKVMATELMNERQKHGGDDAYSAFQKEKEKLQTVISCEKLKLKKLQIDYKKLLLLSNDERKKFKMIIMMLLQDRDKLLKQLRALNQEPNMDFSPTLNTAELNEQNNIPNSEKINNLKEKIQTNTSTLILENSLLKEKVAKLELALKIQRLKPDKVNYTEERTIIRSNSEEKIIPKTGCATQLTAHITSPQSKNPPIVTQSGFTEHPFDSKRLKYDAMSVVQSSKDVTLIPTNSHPPIMLADGVTEVTTTGYYSVKFASDLTSTKVSKLKDQSGTDNNCDDEIDGKDNNSLPKPSTTTVTKPQTLLLPAPSIPPKIHRNTFLLRNNLQQAPLSSPNTSGAANFAMNSPNSPTLPGNSPFALHRNNSYKQGNDPGTQQNVTRITRAQFQAVRDKFQGNSSKDTELPYKNEAQNKGSMDSKPSNNVSTNKPAKLNSTLPTVPSKHKVEVNQPTTTKDNTTATRPLPPKQRPSTGKPTQSRPPPLPPKKPNLPTSDKTGTNKSDISRRRPASAKTVPNTTDNVAVKPRRTVSLKRGMNVNNNNNLNDQKNSYPTPPTSVRTTSLSQRTYVTGNNSTALNSNNHETSAKHGATAFKK